MSIALGATDFYDAPPGPLARDELATTLSTVDAIAAALLDADATLEARLDRDRLSSMAVHRAAGMIMEQLGNSIEEALIRLRATAYAEDVPIQKLANDVIAGDRRFQEDRGMNDDTPPAAAASEATREDRVAQSFVALGDTLVDDYDMSTCSTAWSTPALTFSASPRPG